jgi:hypothetical protein
MSFCAHASEAEDKRLKILIDEKQQNIEELKAAVTEYATAKDKTAQTKRINGLQANIRDLDTEIKHTGQIPKITIGGKKLPQPENNKNTDKPDDTTNEEQPIEKRKFESWDIFKNFNNGQ